MYFNLINLFDKLVCQLWLKLVCQPFIYKIKQGCKFSRLSVRQRNLYRLLSKHLCTWFQYPQFLTLFFLATGKAFYSYRTPASYRVHKGSFKVLLFSPLLLLCRKQGCETGIDFLNPGLLSLDGHKTQRENVRFFRTAHILIFLSRPYD